MPFDFPLALFDISISNIDCRYIDTFEKYRYQYAYVVIFENIDSAIDIDKAILEIFCLFSAYFGVFPLICAWNIEYLYR